MACLPASHARTNATPPPCPPARTNVNRQVVVRALAGGALTADQLSQVQPALHGCMGDTEEGAGAGVCHLLACHHTRASLPTSLAKPGQPSTAAGERSVMAGMVVTPSGVHVPCNAPGHAAHGVPPRAHGTKHVMHQAERMKHCCQTCMPCTPLLRSCSTAALEELLALCPSRLTILAPPPHVDGCTGGGPADACAWVQALCTSGPGCEQSGSHIVSSRASKTLGTPCHRNEGTCCGASAVA